MNKTLAALALLFASVPLTLATPSTHAAAQYGPAPYFDASGHWETDAGAVNGRGSGHFSLEITQSGTGLRWSAANGGMYVCTLRGANCNGTWSGTSGSGWFDVTFSPDGGAFVGSWGYGDDHFAVGSWSGHRS